MVDELTEHRHRRLTARAEVTDQARRLHTDRWNRREETTLRFLWLLYERDLTLTTQERSYLAQVIHLLSEQLAEEDQPRNA